MAIFSLVGLFPLLFISFSYSFSSTGLSGFFYLPPFVLAAMLLWQAASLKWIEGHHIIIPIFFTDLLTSVF